MSRDFLPLYSLISYIVCLELIATNSVASTLWKLNTDTKIIESANIHHDGPCAATEVDIFDIITSTVHLGQSWVKEYLNYCIRRNISSETKDKMQMQRLNRQRNNTFTSAINNKTVATKQSDEVLDCGKPVNFTYYDQVLDVLNYNRHPRMPDMRPVLDLSNKNMLRFHVHDMDIDELERKLKKAKREKPKSIQLYAQIGDFWLRKGDGDRAIECFRRALAVSPENAEVLLNLAKVLFTLKHLNEAIYLTRRAMSYAERESHEHFLMLGRIFIASGHYHEASANLRRALELKPGYELAQLALKEIEHLPVANIHVYTLLIILCLVVGVMLVILSSVEGKPEEADLKPQRHFNKAMAMRSIRGLGIRNARSKKSTC